MGLRRIDRHPARRRVVPMMVHAIFDAPATSPRGAILMRARRTMHER
jgi:hypothetical protein